MPQSTLRLASLSLLLLAGTLLYGQSPDATKSVDIREPYVLTLTLKITDQGKVTTNQTYTLTALTANSNATREFSNGNVRDGDKVPVVSGGEGDKTQIQYVDTGTNIDVDSLQKNGSMLVMHITIENSAAIANPNSKEEPIIRQTRYKISPVVVSGTTSTIYSSSDAANGHKVEISLLAKPLETK